MLDAILLVVLNSAVVCVVKVGVFCLRERLTRERGEEILEQCNVESLCMPLTLRSVALAANRDAPNRADIMDERLRYCSRLVYLQME